MENEECEEEYEPDVYDLADWYDIHFPDQYEIEEEVDNHD